MAEKVLLTEDPAYVALAEYYAHGGGKSLNMNRLFAEDPERFNKYR